MPKSIEEKNMEECIHTMSKLIKAMIASTFLQRNVNMTIKYGLPKLQKALNSLIESRRATPMVYRHLKDRKNIKRRASDAISPESQMTPSGKNTKKLKGRIKKRTPWDSTLSLPRQEHFSGCTTKEKKEERKQRAKTPRYGIKNTNYGEERRYQQTLPTPYQSRAGQTSRRKNLRGHPAGHCGVSSCLNR